MRIYINEGSVVLEDPKLGMLSWKNLLKEAGDSHTFLVELKGKILPVTLSYYIVGKKNWKDKGVSTGMAKDGASASLFAALAKTKEKDDEKNTEPFRIRAFGPGLEDENGVQRDLILFFSNNSKTWTRQFIPNVEKEELEKMGSVCCIAEHTDSKTRQVTFGNGFGFPVEELTSWDKPGAFKFTGGRSNVGKHVVPAASGKGDSYWFATKRMESGGGFLVELYYKAHDSAAEHYGLKKSFSDNYEYGRLKVYFNSENPSDQSKWNIVGAGRPGDGAGLIKEGRKEKKPKVKTEEKATS